MKKLFLKSTFILGTSLLGLVAMAGCGGGENNNKTDVLNIVCLNKGYGRAWIDDLVKVWESENPGYTVNLQALASADELIKKDIYKRDNPDDLYIGNSKDWKTYASQDKFLALDDFLDEKVDGMTIKEKIKEEYGKSIYYGGHTYRLPWTSGVPGIYYNSKMFEKNGWSVPTTYEELVALCNTISSSHIKIDPYGPNNDKNYVKPFIFHDQTYYFDYAVFTWWGQLAGKAAIDDFLKYESAQTFSSANPAFNKLGEALNLWYGIFGNEANYVSGSLSLSYELAQQSFWNGSAAMICSTDWIYNEVLDYTDSGKFADDFDIKLMKTPIAPNAADSHISYVVGEDNYFAIPKSSIKADKAKSFIKLMISDRGIETFTNKARGTMAYKTSSSIVVQDPYVQSLNEYLDNATNRFTNWSDSKLFLKNQIDIWTDNEFGKPYNRIIGQNPITVDECMKLLSQWAASKWSDWESKAGN